MKINIVLLILLGAVCGFASSVVFGSPGQCRYNQRPKQNLDWDLMAGRWYIQYQERSRPRDVECDQVEVYVDPSGTFMNLTAIYFNPMTLQIPLIKGAADIPPNTDTSSANITFYVTSGAYPMNFRMEILAASYGNWAVLYTCYNQGPESHAEGVYVVSRDPRIESFSIDDKETIDAILMTNYLPVIKHLQQITHTCGKLMCNDDYTICTRDGLPDPRNRA